MTKFQVSKQAPNSKSQTIHLRWKGEWGGRHGPRST